MENIKEKIFKFLHLDSLVDNASGYVEARLELYKMEIREEMAKVFSRAIIYMIIGFVGILLLIFLSIGFAYFVNRFFTETYIGFWIVAGIYGIVFLIVLVFRKDIDRGFERHFIEMIKRKHK